MKRSDFNIDSKGKLNCRAQGKTERNSRSLKLVKKVNEKPDQATCKPLSGKVFYLDLPTNTFSENLEKDIKELGGTIEGFLSKDISYLISNKREAKFAHTLRQFSPEASPESTQNVGNSSPRPNSKRSTLDGSLQKTAATVRISRGKSLVEKVIKDQELISSNSVLSNALSWGVKVIHVDDIKNYIEQKKACNVIKKTSPSVKEAGKGGNQKAKSGRLKKPFLKVEDRSSHYRPFYLQLSSFPVVNYSVAKTCSPFDVDKKICTGQNHNQTIRNKINTERESETQVQQSFKEKKKKGYCECCMKKYEDLQSHVESEQHKTFAESAHYQVIDDMITTFVYDFVECRKDENKRAKCSTGAIIPVETVLRKDQLEERFKKVHILQQPSFKKRPVSSIQEFESDEQPTKTFNCSLPKPSSISEPADSPFPQISLQIFTSEVINNPENCKTKNPSHSDGMTVISNCIKLITPNKDDQDCIATVSTFCKSPSNVRYENNTHLDEKHVQCQQAEMQRCNPTTEVKHCVNETGNRMPKSLGRLSLKKRKVDGSLIFPTKGWKVQNIEPSVAKIPDNFTSEEHCTVPEIGQLVYSPVNNASFILPSTDAKTTDLDSGVGNIPNSFSLENHHLKESWTVNEMDRVLQYTPVKDTSSVFLAKDFKTSDFNRVVCTIPNSFRLDNNRVKENCNIQQEGQVLQHSPINPASFIFPAKDFKTSDFNPRVGKCLRNFGSENQHMIENCSTHAMGQDLQVSPVKEGSFIVPAEDFHSSDLNPVLDKVVDNFELGNHHLNENCTIHEGEQISQNSPVHDVSLMFQATQVKTSDVIPVVSTCPIKFSLKSHHLKDCTINEDGRVSHNSPLNNVSFVFPAKDLRTSDIDLVIGNIPENLHLGNRQMKEKCAVREMLHDHQNSPIKDASFIFPIDITTSDFDAVLNKMPKNFVLENHHLNKNCTIHKARHDAHSSLINDTSFILPEKDFKTSYFDSLVDPIPNNLTLENQNLNENYKSHEERQVLGSSRIKGVSCICPAKDSKILYLDPVFGNIPSSFRSENQQMKENCTLHEMGQVLYNAPLKDSSLILPAQCVKADIHPVVDQTQDCLELENPHLKEKCSFNEMGQLLHHSPVNSGKFIFPTKCLKMSVFDPFSKISYRLRFEKYPSKEHYTNLGKGPLLHNSPLQEQTYDFSSTDCLQTGKLQRKVKVSSGRSTRGSQKERVVLYPKQANEMAAQCNDCVARSSSADCLLELFQTSEGHSDFLGFTSYSEDEGPHCSKDYWEDQRSSTPIESLLELFQTSEAHSDFLGFTSYSGKEGRSFSNDYWEGQLSSSPIESLLELFQTSDIHSDFRGFTSFSENEGTSCPNDYWEEKGCSTTIESLVELFQTSEAHSDFLGFTSYSGKDATRFSNNYWEEQRSSIPVEGLLKLFQTSETHSDFMGFTSYSGQEGPRYLRNNGEEQSSSAPWSLFGQTTSSVSSFHKF